MIGWVCFHCSLLTLARAALCRHTNTADCARRRLRRWGAPGGGFLLLCQSGGGGRGLGGGAWRGRARCGEAAPSRGRGVVGGTQHIVRPQPDACNEININ